ncbi:hypothetical protein ACLVWU_16965 [Bdellovibrio sp. HCB290]|uniref:hypothetical protein n=1 Tax=Bdellovibrio sp. HCB290 TaxID=3394356 RepID=UPI0039B52B2A
MKKAMIVIATLLCANAASAFTIEDYVTDYENERRVFCNEDSVEASKPDSKGNYEANVIYSCSGKEQVFELHFYVKRNDAKNLEKVLHFELVDHNSGF